MNSALAILPADTLLKRAGVLLLSDSVVLSANPQLSYSKHQMEISRLEKRLEQSKLLPDISIGYYSQTIQGEQTVNGVPRTFGAGDRFTGIQAGIAVPLWFAPNAAKIKAAKLKEQLAKTNAENETNMLKGNYNSLLGEYAKFSNSLNYYENQAVPEADLIIDQASKSYKAGAIDYLDYIQSLSRALTIRQNYLDVLNNYNQTIISIDYITGKTI